MICNLTIWEAAVSGCATAQRISWGEQPAGRSPLSICTSGTSLLLLQTVRAAVFSPSKSSTRYYIFLFSNKIINFYETLPYIYIRMGGRRVSVCTCVYFGFLVSKLSKMSTAKMKNLLESSNRSTIMNVHKALVYGRTDIC